MNNDTMDCTNQITRDEIEATCTNYLACCIASRFLNKDKESIEPSDIEFMREKLSILGKPQTMMISSSDGRRFKLKFKVEESSSNRMDNKLLQNICTYVNEDTELKQLYHNYIDENEDEINATMCITVRDGAVQIDYKNYDYTRFQKTIKPIISTQNNYGLTIGTKELEKDLGATKHNDFIKSFFGLDLEGSHHMNEYVDNVSKDSTDLGVRDATKKLFSNVSCELNKVLNTDSSILGNMGIGIFSTISGQKVNECDILKIDRNTFQLYVIKYDSILDYLDQQRITVRIKQTLAPTMEFMGENDQSIFNVCLRREKYPSSITGYRYKTHIEPSKDMMEFITTT